MITILDHTTRPVTVKHEDGSEEVHEEIATVNYIDHTGALRGLQFLPAGTDVSGDLENSPRIVGEHIDPEGNVLQHFSFTSPQEAVNAYENGEVR